MDDLAYETMLVTSDLIAEQKRYLFATEYYEPTKALYDRISKYIDPEYRDYEAFCNGEQIVVFLRKNANNVYDKSIKLGTEIRYPYYKVKIFPNDIDFGMNEEVINVFNKYEGTHPTSKNEEAKAYYANLDILMQYGAAGSAKVAGIVYIDENNEVEFEDILSQNAYYSAIASKAFANKLIDTQNELIKDIMQNEYENCYKEEYKLSVKDNYFRIKFNDEAIFLATDNIIKAYCAPNEIMVENYFEKNNMYREQYFTSMLQNIVTVLLAIGVNIVVMCLLSGNRFRNRKKRFDTLIQVGMSKKQLLQICILEVLREDIWCIITLPIMLPIQYILYRVKIGWKE